MPLLSASDLGKSFGGVQALSGFSASLEPGEVVGLIGPNGAGKTTAFNVLTGVLAASTGTTQFDGIDVTRRRPEERARLGMTRTFQNIRLFEDLTVSQNVMAGAHARASSGLWNSVFGTGRHHTAERRIREIAEAALARTGLSHFAGRRADALSYGDKRRVEIARALASGPKLLLLDEPAAGMNDAEKADLARLVRQLNRDDGLSILLVEHNVGLVADLCDRLIVMNKGEILADGSTEDVLRLPEVAEVYLGRRRERVAAKPC